MQSCLRSYYHIFTALKVPWFNPNYNPHSGSGAAAARGWGHNVEREVQGLRHAGRVEATRQIDNDSKKSAAASEMRSKMQHPMPWMRGQTMDDISSMSVPHRRRTERLFDSIISEISNVRLSH